MRSMTMLNHGTEPLQADLEGTSRPIPGPIHPVPASMAIQKGAIDALVWSSEP